MYTRYDVRNTCFRMKTGKAGAIEEVINQLAPQIEEKNWSWNTFSVVWDVAINGNQITAIPRIDDLPQVEATCSQKQALDSAGVEKKWSLEELAIIDMVESQFLDGIMDWENYRKEWGVKKESDTNRIVTYLLNKKPEQRLQVTQEVIDEKIKEQLKASENTAEEARKLINTIQHTIKLGE